MPPIRTKKAPSPPPAGPALVRRSLLAAALGLGGCIDGDGDDGGDPPMVIAPMAPPPMVIAPMVDGPPMVIPPMVPPEDTGVDAGAGDASADGSTDATDDADDAGAGNASDAG